ncbi:sensor histidine kinase [Alicyclobacillus dauci]|uniref:histidine kinase n=1 Tax=Alicyclobacillus dauci TaxID=1475485 RepID=A0ABY6Z438_9BACL|nr:HAMP domain-containing sensor histidine kinase [Alicyclobacillus dauci]WAH37607.1 HAMP domain-containing histidine kinase [Alicyclobacillus dauci]
MIQGSSVRFSLRLKVLSILFAVMVAILLLSNSLYYWSTKSILEQKAIAQNITVSKQIRLEIQQSQTGQSYIDDLLGDELNKAAIAIKYALNPDVSKVTNKQLSDLAAQLNISGITLFKPTKDDIVAVKSSDPKEVGLSTKNMNLWYRAFRDLLNGHPEASKFGKSAPNFWTGPFSNASSDPSKINKWGYYYDGTTNYMIDPFVESSALKTYTSDVGVPSFITNIQKSEPQLLSIAVLNQTFGQTPIVYTYGGNTWVDVANKPVMYGHYDYENLALDTKEKDLANQTGHTVSVTDFRKGQKVLKTFVPESENGSKFVVEIVTNYNVVSNTLDQQLHNSLLISASLLLLVILLSYFTSGFIVKPLREITEKVNRIADRRFDEPVTIHRQDEIGVLANSVNTMSMNLLEYLHESVRKERGQGVSYLMMVMHALIHELRNPIVVMKYLQEFLPKIQQMNERGEEVVERMRLVTEHANSVVRDFGDFLKNGKLNLREHSLLNTIAGALEVLRPVAEERDIDIQLRNLSGDDEVLVVIDDDKLRMVFVNLIQNSMDAIDTERTIREVTLTVTRDQNDVSVDIHDTGHGIAREQWDEIFMPYKSTKKNGFGLGLTYCGFVVLSHGGMIQVIDSDDTGTTMRVRLPLSGKCAAPKYDGDDTR